MADHSAKAARDMGVLIDAAVHRVDSGVRQVADSRAKFAEVRHSVEEVNDLLRRIVASSDQQNREIEQIHKLNLAMEQATAHHTDLAAESAAAAESMSRHAEELNRVVADLVAVVGQGARDGNGSALPRGSAAAQGRMIGYTPLRQPT
ncbi:MAG: Methyl-accepting chemotaxis protein IV [Syntrophaceae bacterium PtaU1.Bin231]|nr:MAG: Methyl-accepting chemotaxis protein IV [Syntrophaceae bacterium PtaU1.Bin231]